MQMVEDADVNDDMDIVFDADGVHILERMGKLVENIGIGIDYSRVIYTTINPSMTTLNI